MNVTRTLTAVLAAGACALIPATAVAKGGGSDRDIRAGGTCSKSSTAKLKLSPENRRIEVEFEVDQNRNGVPWKVTLRRNGAVVARRSVRTKAPSGSFSIRALVSNRAGKDRIVAVATRRGERCVASATFA